MQLWKALFSTKLEKSPFFIPILCIASSISIIRMLYTPLCDAVKVLTQNWEQKIWGKANPNEAELVRLHSVEHKTHSRAQNWYCNNNMVILVTTFVNQFVSHKFTTMIKQISFQREHMEAWKLWRVWGVKWINTKQFAFQYVIYHFFYCSYLVSSYSEYPLFPLNTKC